MNYYYLIEHKKDQVGKGYGIFMNYFYLYKYERDQEGYREVTNKVIQRMGIEKFDSLYYKSKIKHIKLAYLAKLLVDIYFSLSPEDRVYYAKIGKKDTNLVRKPRKDCKDAKCSQD